MRDSGQLLALIAGLALPWPQVAARAADLVPAESAWTGPYIGVHLGYKALDVSNSVSGGFPQRWEQGADGFMGGVLVGYNYDMQGWIAGLEADAGFGFIKDSATRPGLGRVRITDHGQHTFRLRGGLPVGDGLIYASGGLALADMRMKAATGSDSSFLWGFVIGAGYETRLTARLWLRGEYLYANYGKERFNLGAATARSEVDSHRFRAGIAYRF